MSERATSWSWTTALNPDGLWAPLTLLNTRMKALSQYIGFVPHYRILSGETGIVDPMKPWFCAQRYGVSANATDNGPAFQVWVNNIVRFNAYGTCEPGRYTFSTPFTIFGWGTFDFGGRPDGAWGLQSTNGTQLVWTGGGSYSATHTLSSYAILIGGTADTPTSYRCEGLTIRNLYLRPETLGTAGDGLFFDGSNERVALRRAIRDVVLDNVHVESFAGVNIRLVSSVFHFKTYDCSSSQRTAPGIACYRTEDGNSFGSADRPGQVHHHEFFLFSASGNGSGSPGYGADCSYTTFFGGHFQGNGHGAKIGQSCNIWGTHIEGNNAANTIGVHLTNRGAQIYPERQITKFATGVKIGETGSATQADQYRGFVGLILNCTTGVHITDGGTRQGQLDIGRFDDSVTTPILDDRFTVDAVRDFQRWPITTDSTGQSLLAFKHDTNMPAELRLDADAVSNGLPDGLSFIYRGVGLVYWDDTDGIYRMAADASPAAIPAKLYLRNSTPTVNPGTAELSTVLPVGTFSDLSGGTARALTTTRGTQTGATAASIVGNSIAQLAQQDNFFGSFSTLPLAAQTIAAGTWTFAICCAETNASANSFFAFSAYVYRPSTLAVVGYLYDSAAPLGNEWSAAGAQVRTGSFVGGAVVAAAGDILVVEVWRDATQASATAYSQSMFFDSSQTNMVEGAASKGSYVECPQQLVFQ